MGLNPTNRLSKYWSVIWLATIWTIWLARNDFIFNSIRLITHKIFEDARFKAWLWIKGSLGSNFFSLADWIVSPFSCLNKKL
ncbi:unnamed protein product [Lupinus luteus]|uniref:Uncharacterized protein n=1 Tax=Lupinus luteus TaxID=3873 RepID=A0AAV1XBE4_LUPLU